MRVTAPASMSISRASSIALLARPSLSIHSGFHCASVRSCCTMRRSTSRRISSITPNS